MHFQQPELTEEEKEQQKVKAEETRVKEAERAKVEEESRKRREQLKKEREEEKLKKLQKYGFFLSLWFFEKSYLKCLLGIWLFIDLKLTIQNLQSEFQNSNLISICFCK